MPPGPRTPRASLIYIDSATVPGYVLEGTVRRASTAYDHEESPLEKVIWYVEDGHLTIGCAGPFVFHELVENRRTTSGTMEYTRCGFGMCDTGYYKRAVDLTMTGLDSLAGVYAVSFYDRYDFTKIAGYSFFSRVAAGDKCDVLALNKYVPGFAVPGVTLTFTGSASIEQDKRGVCGNMTADDTYSGTSKAFFIQDIGTVPPGIPKLLTMGIYVRDWPICTITEGGYDPTLMMEVPNSCVWSTTPVWLGRSPGGGGGYAPGAGPNPLTSMQALYFEQFIHGTGGGEETIHMMYQGGGDGVVCYDQGVMPLGELNIDLSDPHRIWSAVANPPPLPLTNQRAVECCKPATCEIDVPLPNATPMEGGVCILPVAPIWRPPRDPIPPQNTKFALRKKITVAGSVATITITVRNDGPCSSEVTVRDRIPGGLSAPTAFTNNRGSIAGAGPYTFKALKGGDPTAANTNTELVYNKLCVNDVMTITYTATITDIDDIYDWVEVSVVEFADPDPTVIADNLTVTPSNLPGCRERDEALAVLDGEILTAGAVDCAALCETPPDVDCQYPAECELLDQRGVGCCLVADIFREAYLSGGQVCNFPDEYSEGASICYVVLFETAQCDSPVVNLEASVYLKYKSVEDV